MFSGNQVLEVTGDMSSLADALSFAIKLYGYDEHLTPSEIERGCKIVYQITADGKYCIGHAFQEVPDGWKEYPFDFDIDIISKIIVQHLNKTEAVNQVSGREGSKYKGFLMACEDTSWTSGIVNVNHNIVYFHPYILYRGK